MITHDEQKWMKSKCKELNIEENVCSNLMSSFPFATMNSEAEYWLNEKDKKITEKRIEILVSKADDAMEETAEDIEEEEKDW